MAGQGINMSIRSLTTLYYFMYSVKPEHEDIVWLYYSLKEKK